MRQGNEEGFERVDRTDSLVIEYLHGRYYPPRSLPVVPTVVPGFLHSSWRLVCRHDGIADAERTQHREDCIHIGLRYNAVE